MTYIRKWVTAVRWRNDGRMEGWGNEKVYEKLQWMWMDGGMGGWMWLDGWIDGWMDG